MEPMPPKSINVVHIPSGIKRSICIVCSACIASVKNRRRLHKGDEKMKFCAKLESVLNVTITQADLSYICESCARKLNTLEAKITKMKNQFEMNKENMCLRYGQGEIKHPQCNDTQPNKSRKNPVHDCPECQHIFSQAKENKKSDISVSIQ